MAITGTGTQADPYIVTTIGEVLEKCAEANAYVCLANDIYVKEDPDYREGSNTPIIINCTKFYSTNSSGNYKSIIGYRCLASQTYNFNIITIGANVEVDHIGFLSFFNDRSTETINSAYSDLYCDDSSTVTNCNFSLCIKSLIADNPTLLHGKWDSCTFYFYYTQRTSGYINNVIWPYTNYDNLEESQGITRSYIRINSLNTPSALNNFNEDDGIPKILRGIWNSTIYMDIKYSYVRCNGESYYSRRVALPDNSCRNDILNVFLNQNSTQGDYLGCIYSGYNCLVNAQYVGNWSTSWYETANGSSAATYEQLKDRQFLLDNGFV